jgi:hypothetical protein
VRGELDEPSSAQHSPQVSTFGPSGRPISVVFLPWDSPSPPAGLGCWWPISNGAPEWGRALRRKAISWRWLAGRHRRHRRGRLSGVGAARDEGRDLVPRDALKVTPTGAGAALQALKAQPSCLAGYLFDHLVGAAEQRELERYTKRPRSCMPPLGKPWPLKACVGSLPEYAANNAFLLRECHSAGQNPRRLAGA